MKHLKFVLLGLSVAAGVHASPNLEIDRVWMRISDPLIMGANNREFSSLPLSGGAADKQKYWSADYWARNKGGINYRWNAARPTGFGYSSPTKSQALGMTQSQLAALAPSEKWDIFIGRFDYPVKREIAAYASPSRPSWEGICDGWAGAALNHDEPRPVVMTSPDGVQVPFGSSDIKGLLSWYYSRKWSGGNSQMGRRCYGTASSVDRCTHDMNAGAFHLVLTNRLGMDGKSFIADIDRNHEVWNHLAYDYRSTIRNSNLPPGSTSASGTVKRIRVRTVVNYVFLLIRNTWEPVLGTSRQRLSSRTYEYYLDIDSNGRIIGGDWITLQRPDFLWLERKVTSFTGIFSKLGQLLSEIPAEEGEIFADAEE